MAVLGIHVHHVKAVTKPPLFVQCAVRIHEVALTSILYEAVLHSVVLIIISATRTVYEAVCNDQVGVILELIVYIHTAVYARNDTAAGILPERRIGIFAYRVVLCNPFVIRGCRDLADHPVFAGINHRIIACLLYGAAKCHRQRCQLIGRHVFMDGILQVIYDRIADRIRFHRCNGKLSLRHRALYGCRIRVNVDADLHASCSRSRHIHRIIRV